MINTIYNPRDYDYFVGIDVDSKSFAFTVMDQGVFKRSNKIPSQSHMLVKYIQKNLKRSRMLCAYEAGGSGFGLYDTLKANNIECLIVPPNAIPHSKKAMVKNNRLDSQRIAQAIKSADISPIRVPSEKYRELRHLIRVYDNYAQSQAVAKRRIKALLLFENLYKDIADSDARWTQQFIQKLKQCPCSQATRIRLDALLNDLEYARTHLAETLRTIKNFCNNSIIIHEYMDCLVSIPGIGIRTASYILGKIGDPSQLRNPRELGAFFGLTPKENSTGDRIKKGSISHSGNAIARSLLTEAAWVSIRYDKELFHFYHRIRSRNPKQSGSQKAITAVARKLTSRIYAVLKHKKKYTLTS